MNKVPRRNTKQRELILNELAPRRDHPTAEDIYQAVKDQMARISLGTVYRNLLRLAEEGQILVLNTGEGQRRFDPHPHHHPHFRCTRCGKVEDIPAEVFQGQLVPDQSSEWLQSRRITEISVLCTGFCPDCAGMEPS